VVSMFACENTHSVALGLVIGTPAPHNCVRPLYDLKNIYLMSSHEDSGYKLA